MPNDKPHNTTMDGDLKEALETLYDFRQFVLDNVTQSRLGAGATNPMWTRLVALLDKHGMNDGAILADTHESRYFVWDQAYYCR